MEKTDKVIVAEFDGFTQQKSSLGNTWIHPDKMGVYGGVGMAFKYTTDRNEFHRAWEKFRDLKFDDRKLRFHHEMYSDIIVDRMAYGNLLEAFEELVRGIKWVNSIKDK